LPEKSGAAFVIVKHLDPIGAVNCPTFLATDADAVVQVEDSEKPRTDHAISFRLIVASCSLLRA
jgi:hypothetical protein